MPERTFLVAEASNLDRLMSLRGSECEFCGYCETTRALKFVHMNKEEKREWRLKDEYENCILLCSNCRIDYGYDFG